jgi:hypothetical protein
MMLITNLLVRKASLVLIFNFALITGGSYKIVAQGLIDVQIIAGLSDIVPPDTNPSGNSVPGGSLNPLSICGSNDPSLPKLTALVPEEQEYRFTLSERPSFWFYIPYTSQQVSYGEFSVLIGRNESKKHVVRFTLPTTPGIIRISLPDDLSLQEEENYHWYLSLYCKTDPAATNLGLGSEASYEIVDGWIQRIAHSPDRDQAVIAGEPYVWYDSLSFLAEQYWKAPQDRVLRERLRTLLNYIDRADLLGQPLLEPTNLPLTSEPVTD